MHYVKVQVEFDKALSSGHSPNETSYQHLSIL